MTGKPPDRSTPPWGTDRALIVAGLRELAAFLEEHTDLPLPNLTDVLHSVIGDNDTDEHTEVDRIAAILGVIAEPAFDGRHYVATAFFGPVSYRAVAISDEEMERHRADMGHVDVIRPEVWPI